MLEDLGIFIQLIIKNPWSKGGIGDEGLVNYIHDNLLCNILFIRLSDSPRTALRNGDLINGQVIRMDENKLIFKTSYAGEISVDWAEVINLITDEPIKVILTDGTALEGFSREASANMMRIETEKLEAPSDFKLSEVARNQSGRKASGKNNSPHERGTHPRERQHRYRRSCDWTVNLSLRTEKSRYSFGGELNIEKVDGDTTVENWLAFGNYDYFVIQKWFLYANTLFEHDKFADLDLRSTLGVGVRSSVL